MPFPILSNHLYWTKHRKPGGMGKYSKFFGKKVDMNYKKMLLKSGFCDTLIGVIKK